MISRLERGEYQAYLVGGCVRDLLIGRPPKDFDVATDAHPRQIKRMFRNGRIIGRRFKLVHIYYGAHIVEVATFRREPYQKEPEAEVAVDGSETAAEVEDNRLDDLLITGADDLIRLVSGAVGFPQLLASGRLELAGNPFVALRFPGLFRLPARARRK